MAIVYSWVFPRFEVAPSEDGLTDVVRSIIWTYTATDGDYTANVYGELVLPPPNPDNFVPYNQITEQWAIDLVSASRDMTSLQEKLAQNIENQKNPPVVPMAPPF